MVLETFLEEQIIVRCVIFMIACNNNNWNKSSYS